MSLSKAVYEPNETVAQRAARERRHLEEMRVLEAIRKQAGIASKDAIAKATGLTETDVAQAIRRINTHDSGYLPVAYGKVRDHGETLTGWFSVDRKPRHVLLEQEGEHIFTVAVGLRRSLLEKLAKATGLPRAGELVAKLEGQLDVNVEVLNARDLETFQELLLEQAESLNGAAA